MNDVHSNLLVFNHIEPAYLSAAAVKIWLQWFIYFFQANFDIFEIHNQSKHFSS